MKVVSVRNISKSQPVQVMDCCVEGGYLKKSRGSLPDVDLDFAADKRDAVKAHLGRNMTSLAPSVCSPLEHSLRQRLGHQSRTWRGHTRFQ